MLRSGLSWASAVTLTLALAPAPWSSHALGQGADVIVTRLPQNQAEVSIAVNPNNAANLVVMGNSEATNDHSNATFSLDGGRTWRSFELGRLQPRCDTTGQKGDCIGGFRADPAVVFDDYGRLYVGVGAPNSGEFAVCRSDDGGQSYIGCTSVQGAGAGADKWLLATGPDPCVADATPCNPMRHNVYAAWTAGGRVWFSRSLDRGMHFSTRENVGGFGLPAQPAVGPNGEVYVSWFDAFTRSTIYVARLDHATGQFGQPAIAGFSQTQIPGPFSPQNTGGLIIPAQPDRGVFVGPVLDVDRSGGTFNGRLYLAYTDRGAGGRNDMDIFVTTSSDNGVTWSTPVQVNHDGGANSQFLPWLSVDQRTGLVSVAWFDARNDPDNQRVEMFVAFSADGGANFGDNILVSDRPTDGRLNFLNLLEYVGVATRDCVAYLVWPDNGSTVDLEYVSDLVAAPQCPGGRGRAPRYLIGDRDGFHAGDAADTPPRSPQVRRMLSAIGSLPGQHPAVNLDQGGVDRPVGLTHFLRLPPRALITSAIVKFRVRSSDALVINDGVYYNDTPLPVAGSPILPVIALRDLRNGVEPVLGPGGAPFQEEITLDLGKAPIRTRDTTGGPGGHWTGPPDALRNLIPVLIRDGRLDLIFSDDLTVDYSELSLTYTVEGLDRAGDLDGNGNVDLDDIALIMRALNTDAYPGDPRDLNGDRRITIEDARLLSGICSNPRCAR